MRWFLLQRSIIRAQIMLQAANCGNTVRTEGFRDDVDAVYKMLDALQKGRTESGRQLYEKERRYTTVEAVPGAGTDMKNVAAGT
jgi:hypothetical protein